MNIDLLYKYDYYLKWKDEIVLRFNPTRQELTIENKDLLPISISNLKPCYDMIVKFCADRILMLNREYCKEILLVCGIDDQTAIPICLISKAFSFRDNYWITPVRSDDTWDKVNLYANEFSQKIAKVALTGERCNYEVGDSLVTGELTCKGTRAKCYARDSGNIYLYKNETTDEISSELVSCIVAEAVGVPYAQYWFSKYNDKPCSVCQILTNSDCELIPYRDLLSAFSTGALDFVRNIDPLNLARMILFDYLTLNTDRNRDNFGLLRYKGKIVSMYPIYDHDACFKGKSTGAFYFVTGKSFNDSLATLKQDAIYEKLGINEIVSKLHTPDFKDTFIKLKNEALYNELLQRASIL